MVRNKEMKYVVITRSKEESHQFAASLVRLGFNVLYCPSIVTTKNLFSSDLEKYFSNISLFDIIIFTSSNGVKYFIEGLQELGENLSNLENIKISVIGQKTADTAKKYGLSINFIPSRSTSVDLGKELNNIKGNNILLPRSDIGNPDFKTKLEAKGAIVTDMPIYKTEHLKTDMTEFNKLLKLNEIFCITFTSPSAVEGFLENIKEYSEYKRIFSIPVLSIGPTTTKTLKNYRFENIYTADTHTLEGMVTKLRVINL